MDTEKKDPTETRRPKADERPPETEKTVEIPVDVTTDETPSFVQGTIDPDVIYGNRNSRKVADIAAAEVDE